MTKPQSTAAYVLRLTLTLFLITVIVAGLLAFVNYLTADTIAEHSAEAARSAMTQVLAADDYTELPVSDAQAATGVTAAWSAGDAGTVVRLTTNGFGGAIDLMVGVDKENRVTGVAIISHSETASLGANCTREDFRAQFAGKTGELAVSKDGVTLDSKQCLLTNRDYPAGLTCHVRDPKVFAYEGRYYMVLGARTLEDKGEVLVLESTDKLRWNHINTLTTLEPFGYMWECPDLFCLDGQWYLAVSPQGIDCQNVYGCGWFAIHGDWRGDCTLSEFHELDAGFDYYAPQSFVDGNGRRIQIGWMGMPDEPTYGNAPTVACGWQHCMTVPRELTAGDGGVVLQRPAREIERHYASVRVGEGSLEVSGDTCFDVVVDGVDDAFTATVDGELRLAFVPAEGDLPAYFEMRFTDEGRASAGCGRTVRWEPVDEVRNVRIVGDVSSVEVFVNDGALVFSTRIYPEAYGVTVDAPGASVNYHTLNI